MKIKFGIYEGAERIEEYLMTVDEPEKGIINQSADQIGEAILSHLRDGYAVRVKVKS